MWVARYELVDAMYLATDWFGGGVWCVVCGGGVMQSYGRSGGFSAHDRLKRRICRA